LIIITSHAAAGAPAMVRRCAPLRSVVPHAR
jgi:hypothetical protein